MDMFIFFIGFLIIFISLVLFVFNLIKKRPLKKYGISMLVGFIFMIIGLSLPSSIQNELSEEIDKKEIQTLVAEKEKVKNLSDANKIILAKVYDELTDLDKEEILSIEKDYDSYSLTAKEFISINIDRLDEEKQSFEIKQLEIQEQEAQKQQAIEQEAQRQQAIEQEAQEQQARDQEAQRQQAIEQQAQEQSRVSSSNQKQSSEDVGTGVFITKTGSKYHNKKCGNGNYFSSTLKEAQARGLTPCSKCY